jgi:hypothetical protein
VTKCARCGKKLRNHTANDLETCLRELSEEIRKDIADTEAEIVTMEREIQGFRLLGDRLSHMRAESRVTGITQRRDFIAKLEKILTEKEQ